MNQPATVIIYAAAILVALGLFIWGWIRFVPRSECDYWTKMNGKNKK
jgi:hypothetical protein